MVHGRFRRGEGWIGRAAEVVSKDGFVTRGAAIRVKESVKAVLAGVAYEIEEALTFGEREGAHGVTDDGPGALGSGFHFDRQINDFGAPGAEPLDLDADGCDRVEDWGAWPDAVPVGPLGEVVSQDSLTPTGAVARARGRGCGCLRQRVGWEERLDDLRGAFGEERASRLEGQG